MLKITKYRKLGFSQKMTTSVVIGDFLRECGPKSECKPRSELELKKIWILLLRNVVIRARREKGMVTRHERTGRQLRPA